ncbi:MAG: PASTA domain-containing protein, partial [bacterium]|nr:PASTA domain-containing protein [bacterium]
MSAWRRLLKATHVRLEPVRSPAAAVISILVDTGAVEPSEADPGEDVNEDAHDEAPGFPASDGTGGTGGDPEPSEHLASGGSAGADATPAAAPGEAAWAPAPIAGRYRIGEFLGESRLGRTYRATGDDDQDVEVTFLDPEVAAGADGAAERLEQLRNLRHLHVLPLLDWQLGPVPYLVYPAAPMRLHRLIAAGAALSPSQTMLIGLQAAETLHSLRQRGITHGAITPASCCVDARGRLRLAEMGVDFLRGPLQPSEATRYDAPERIEAADADGEPLDSGDTAAAAADVFGLAVVLGESAAGHTVSPQEIGRLGRTLVPRGAGSGTVRNLARLAPLLVQASAPRPENRLEADELALALRATAEMFPPPSRLDEAFRRAEEFEAQQAAPEPEEVETTPRPARTRGRAVSWAAAAAIVVASVLLVILSAPDDDTPAHVMPSVVGMGWPEAADSLGEAGWEVRRLEVRVADAAAGEVVGQLPEAGGLLDEGQIVKVQVNLG